MNDEFLYRLRTQPPARFAASLKTRLDFQAALAAAKRKTAKWYVLCGIFLGVGAVAAATPVIRMTVASWLGSAAETRSTPAASSVARDESRTDTSARPSIVQRTDTRPSRGSVADQPPGMNAVSSAAAVPAASPVRLDVSVVASARVPREVLDMMFDSFEEAHGYSIERRLVSADDTPCSRGQLPDVIVTLGRLSDSQRSLCDRGARLSELPLAYDAYVAVVHRENTWARALTIEDLGLLGGRYPTDTLTTWNQLRASWPSLPITLVGADSTNRASSEPFIPSRGGPGIPLKMHENDANVAATVSATYGALGFMSYATYVSQIKAANTQRSTVPYRVLGIVNQRGDVVMPSLGTIQNGSYDTLSRPLLLYFTNWFHHEGIRLFRLHAVEETSRRMDEHGFVPMPIDDPTMDAARKRR